MKDTRENSKIEEKALKEYPVIMETLIPLSKDMPEIKRDANKWCRECFIRGYKAALKDVRDEIIRMNGSQPIMIPSAGNGMLDFIDNLMK